MKVSKLIELLEQYDPESLVAIDGFDIISVIHEVKPSIVVSDLVLTKRRQNEKERNAETLAEHRA